MCIPREATRLAEIEWRELGIEEPIFINGQLTPNGWVFLDRTLWDVRWFPRTATPDLVKKAEEFLRNCQVPRAES